MPIPFIIVGATIAMGVSGVGLGAKGGYDQHRAQKLNKESNLRAEKASLRLEDLRKKCSKSLQDLGDEKLSILNGSVTKFVDTFSQLKNVNFTESEGLNELSKIQMGTKEFSEMKALTKFSSSILQGSATGIAGGALTAIGAYGAATTLATASTGTAIASLHGVAATNATLAWFGGGSLAAGGAGMAGGAAVLGGIVAGPALLCMGLIVGAKAGKNLENARANAYQTNEICEELENGSIECISIRRRCYMFYNLLARLDSYLTPLTFAMEDIISNEGVDYSLFTEQSKKTVASAAATVSSIKAALDTPILTDSGALTEESDVLLKKLNQEKADE